MSTLTTATRMWLTRTRKPFVFTPDNDDMLDFRELQNLGLYVHIPFCAKICDFCPYCKTLFDKDLCDRYIESLLKEIRKVGASNGEKKEVTSLYFGGGTPPLAAGRIKEIIDEISKYYKITDGIGLELHPGNVNVETLTKLKEAGITKISIGIQSFSPKFSKILGRPEPDKEKIRAALSEVSFETVSMDFIFALPEQSFDDLKSDIDTAFDIGANHIAIYPFIDFTFTGSPVKAMPKKEKQKLLYDITDHCYSKELTRDSIWTFSNGGEAHYSSMTRENFLGFGCSATTLLKDSFKINTFDVNEYIKRVEEDKLPTSLTIRFTKRQRMVYWLFWTLYTTKLYGKDFERFFGKKLGGQYGLELTIGRMFGLLKKKGDMYELTSKGAFYYHYYENFYTLSYIDKMWGIMRKEAFPKGIEL
ncbi:MAG: radical SAM protein [Clostridiales bacterium]|nr:radical SAM protein [Clostridiales bacterium]